VFLCWYGYTWQNLLGHIHLLSQGDNFFGHYGWCWFGTWFNLTQRNFSLALGQ